MVPVPPGWLALQKQDAHNSLGDPILIRGMALPQGAFREAITPSLARPRIKTRNPVRLKMLLSKTATMSTNNTKSSRASQIARLQKPLQ